ncbi:MAG: DUF4870 domain-containing protein [Anaerolineae bacterium]
MEHDPYPIPEPDEEVTSPEEEVEIEGAGDTKKLSVIEARFPEVDVTGDERTMAALAHGSVILTLLTGGFAGLIVAFVIWAVYRDKSRWVAHQSLQALVFQVVATLATYALGLLVAGAITISSILMVVLIGFCLFPFALLLGLVALIFPFAATAYGLFGAIATYQGRDFQYWWVSDLVRGRQLR